jgi:hypothetical protein
MTSAKILRRTMTKIKAQIREVSVQSQTNGVRTWAGAGEIAATKERGTPRTLGLGLQGQAGIQAGRTIGAKWIKEISGNPIAPGSELLGSKRRQGRT